MRELFIYWRASAQSADAALRAAMAWQERLRIAHPHLRASLYRRDEVTADGPAAAHVTLMEVYAIDAQGGRPALDAALERRLISEGEAVLAPWLQGPRKVETFVRCEPA